MKRPFASLIALAAVGCSPTMGEPPLINMPTVAFRADGGTSAEAAGTAVGEAGPRIALVIGRPDEGWFQAVAAAAGLSGLSGPGTIGPDLAVGFLGMAAVGDTTIELRYDDGSFQVHDALYDLDQRRYLDLLAFQVEDPGEARAKIRALTQYIATDVYPGAAVILAVAVPTAEVGDSVARELSPAYRGAAHCGAPADGVAGSGVRLFYGPEARLFCRSATVAATAAGDRVRAELVAGRRR